jgi:hypothetical protein
MQEPAAYDTERGMSVWLGATLWLWCTPMYNLALLLFS